MKRLLLHSVSLSALFLGLAGCGSMTPSNDADKQYEDTQVQGTIQDFKTADAQVGLFLDSAYGYAVFPSIGSGAIGIGGAGGNGEVFQQGKLVGYCQMGEGSIGLQLGGQSFAEIILFQDAAALANFQAGQTAFDARATAVAAGAGNGAAADYQDGVLVFTKPITGLMAQAAIGGQHFSYTPLVN
jgi:lipid-binding SYLF domain-containing protein